MMLRRINIPRNDFNAFAMTDCTISLKDRVYTIERNENTIEKYLHFKYKGTKVIGRGRKSYVGLNYEISDYFTGEKYETLAYGGFQDINDVADNALYWIMRNRGLLACQRASQARAEA